MRESFRLLLVLWIIACILRDYVESAGAYELRPCFACDLALSRSHGARPLGYAVVLEQLYTFTDLAVDACSR
jgi:hypothetical protein